MDSSVFRLGLLHFYSLITQAASLNKLLFFGIPFLKWQQYNTADCSNDPKQ
jgi:hypothetical protein